MPTTAKVQLTWDNSKLTLANNNAVKGLFQLGYDIAAQARINAPYVTGALRSTIRVVPVNNNTLEVIAGGTFGGTKKGKRMVDYAWKREQGPNRNPATEHYMENASKTVMTGDYLRKYFGDIL